MLLSIKRLVAGIAWSLIVFGGSRGLSQTPEVSPQEHARRANEFLKAKNPARAIPELEAFVASEPGDVDGQANLGVLLYFQARYPEAEVHLRKAIALKPDLSRIQALLGLCEYQRGDLDGAGKDLLAVAGALTDAKFRKEVGLTLIQVQTAQHDLTAAAATASKLLEVTPTDPELLYVSYRVHSDMAGEALLSLSLAAPDSGQMQQAIAHELLRTRDLPGAIASFRKAIARDPDLPGVHFELAEALHSSDRPTDKAQAEKEYRFALERNPHEVQSMVRLGDMDADRGDLAGAGELYQRALTQDSTNADAAIGLARTYSEKNENDKALPLLKHVTEADPANMLAHFRLSALYRKLHQPEDAKRELAEYQHYKEIKDGLREVYGTMRLQAPHSVADDPVQGQDAHPSGAPH